MAVAREIARLRLEGMQTSVRSRDILGPVPAAPLHILAEAKEVARNDCDNPERVLRIQPQSFSIGAILISSFFGPAESNRTCATRFAPSPVTASTRPSPKSS